MRSFQRSSTTELSPPPRTPLPRPAEHRKLRYVQQENAANTEDSRRRKNQELQTHETPLLLHDLTLRRRPSTQSMPIGPAHPASSRLRDRRFRTAALEQTKHLFGAYCSREKCVSGGNFGGRVQLLSPGPCPRSLLLRRQPTCPPFPDHRVTASRRIGPR